MSTLTTPRFCGSVGGGPLTVVTTRGPSSLFERRRHIISTGSDETGRERGDRPGDLDPNGLPSSSLVQTRRIAFDPSDGAPDPLPGRGGRAPATVEQKVPDSAQQTLWVRTQVVHPDRHHLPTGVGHGRVPSPVSFAFDTGGMMFGAVVLQRHPLVGPPQIGVEASPGGLDPALGDRSGQPRPVQQHPGPALRRRTAAPVGEPDGQGQPREARTRMAA